MIDPRVRLIYYMLLDTSGHGDVSLAVLKDNGVWPEFRRVINEFNLELDGRYKNNVILIANNILDKLKNAY